jgi:hypothetical protein
MATIYETVIYLDGDDYDEWEALMYPGREPGYLPFPTGHDAAFDHLMQWEYGEPTDHEYDTPPWGGDEYTYEKDGYVMAWHAGLAHASLTRVTNREEEK